MVKIKVDDCFPDVTFFQLVDGNPKTIKTSDIFNEKKIFPIKVNTKFPIIVRKVSSSLPEFFI